MNNVDADRNQRILIIDDNPSIHDDFRKILGAGQTGPTALEQAEAALFGEPTVPRAQVSFQVDSAYQGAEGLALVRAARAAGNPYAMAFVDVRMPPGWDGVETTAKLWGVDPDLQVVICTAYSDCSWDEMIDKIGHSDRLLILKKPFDTVEALQLANALTAKWRLLQQAKSKLEDLERIVSARTRQLQVVNAELLGQITKHKQAEERLHLQGTALESAANAIMITDGQGRITWINPAFTALTGYTAAEALGQTPRLLNSGTQDAAFFKNLWETILAGQVWSGELVNRRKDGTLFWEQTTITPVRNDQQDISHFIAIQQDITDRKRLEEQLLQAQKIEAIGRLAGGVAHDFNNILTAITGYSQLILTRLEDKSWLRHGAKEIEKAAYRAAALTRQLLAFSRKQVLQTKVLDLGRVVAETEKMLSRLIGEDIQVRTQTVPDLGRVKADPGQIEQVIMNLVVNSRDAMPDGGTITIATANVTLDQAYARHHPEVTPGEYVMLAVSDTGTGMTREVQSHLFEPFFTTKPQGKGTGLGLPTCYGIVKQSGGHISADSEPGNGTVFRIYLPRVSQPADPTAGHRPGEERPGGTETVLLVEDEACVREFATLLLEELGYQVLAAADGAEALQLVAERDGKGIALVITDVVMPRMGGKALADHLATRYPALKILLTSGYTEEGIDRRGPREAVFSFMPKPYTPSVLARKVREMLDNGHESPAQERSPAAAP